MKQTASYYIVVYVKIFHLPKEFPPISKFAQTEEIYIESYDNTNILFCWYRYTHGNIAQQK